ncbi:VOC family protein [Actinomycetospora sp. NBRC 106375]|uniref:VOC family protein n=1 Tax=Actinomycetospora sp. NBRC 106375 TaxID=3032207 RepID=UPI002556EC27|nr:VOC family protein [Actinomycetospora sp. NBRC 106375]
MDTWFEGLSLPVSDLDRSVAWYEALGFVCEVRTHQFGLMRLGAGTVGLLDLGVGVTRDADTGGGRLRSFVQVEMGTDDLDVLYADLLARGVAVHTPPRDRGFERSLQLRDPDGFTVEFAEGARGRNRTD